MVDAPLINKMAVKHHDLEMETLDSSTMRTTVEFVISLGHLPSHIGIAGWTHQDNNNNITTFCPIGHQGQRSWSHGFLFVFLCVRDIAWTSWPWFTNCCTGIALDTLWKSVEYADPQTKVTYTRIKNVLLPVHHNCQSMQSEWRNY